MASTARHDLESAIFEALTKAKDGSSITPNDVAQRIEANELRWRTLLKPIRTEATRLARAGRLEILRHGKPIDPEQPFRGVIRLRLPQEPAAGKADSEA
jgi:hypothetical protein